jgi:tetratricopeptide (TPR) repeat protein
MRRFPLALCLVAVIVGGPLAAGQLIPTFGRGPSPARPIEQQRLVRLERWLEAVARHEPGEADGDLQEVAGWSNDALKALFVDVHVLMQLARRGHAGDYRFTDVHYSREQAHRLSVLSCAADGAILEPSCMLIKAGDELDADLRRLAALSRAANLRGDRNYIVRRGALLHGDVAMLVPERMDAPVDRSAADGPLRFRMGISDGREVDFHQSAVHWEIARMLLDFVVPKGKDRPAPGSDDMVRRWYRATAAWMQSREDHDSLHLARGQQIFPDDADLLFLSACQREVYASPAIQAAVRSAVLPAGVTMGVGSPQVELRQAEQLFVRTLQLRRDYSEARLRHGHVLGELGRHAEAAAELRRAAAGLTDPQLLYYASQFAGAEEEALGNREAARLAYEQAAALFPQAQSPLLAMSQLFRRHGDRAAALRVIDRLFALEETARTQTDDPWWSYYVVQARDADELLDELRRPFLEGRLE